MEHSLGQCVSHLCPSAQQLVKCNIETCTSSFPVLGVLVSWLAQAQDFLLWTFFCLPGAHTVLLLFESRKTLPASQVHLN